MSRSRPARSAAANRVVPHARFWRAFPYVPAIPVLAALVGVAVFLQREWAIAGLSYYKPDLVIVVVDWFKAYARPDSATHFYAFYDSDSTHKYTAMKAVELSHNTICASDQMVAFVRQEAGAPPPPLYSHRF